MIAYIISIVVGIVCIAIGISNMRGNISSLHSYHRNRVAEEDIKPLGKKVGLGTIIIGTSIIVCSVCSIVTLFCEKEMFYRLGVIVLGVGLTVGIILCLLAIKKYNKGIF